MSSQLTHLVPVFNGQNYGQWAKAIKVFLRSQGLWGYTAGSIAHPGPGAPAREDTVWQRSSDMARGDIVLHLSPDVQQVAKGVNTVVDLWNALQVGYGSPTVPSIYKDLKEAMSIKIHINSHPIPQIDKVSAAFANLYNVSFGANIHNLGIQDQHQSLILIVALLQKWEHLIPIICQSHDFCQS